MPEIDRPDPDALIAQLRSDEAGQRTGRLRIYFGANAGVGKTWSMLSAAQRERQAGRDVRVGVIETHGRAETAALLEGLAVLPLRQVPYRGRTLYELDLDAAIAARPQVLLVDELAHSNAPGSRHAKRWQDVQELLAAGIDVWTALNVQHLESLNGTVGTITGIRVHETVPDAVLDDADEVVLVDVTPDELLARLKAGKVYVPAQAQQAARNFFRTGNLIALREIALRRTAEHVEDDMRDWRIEHSGSGAAAGGAAQAWNTSGALLVAVGSQPASAQTVRTAARLAGQLNVRWHAVHVEVPQRRLPTARREQALATLQLAQSLGAETAVPTAPSVPRGLAEQAARLNCATLVVGRAAAAPAWRRLWPQASLHRQLSQQLPGVDIVEVAPAPQHRSLARALASTPVADTAARAAASPRPARAAWGFAGATAVSVALTLLTLPLDKTLDEVNIAMLFLLGVLGVALRWGRAPAALAALLNVLSFDYFFVPPSMSFAVSDAQYLVTFAVMLAVGLVIGQLTAGLRSSAGVAAERERRTHSLFELTRELSGALEAGQVAVLGEQAIRAYYGGQAVVVLTDASDRLALPAAPPPGWDGDVAEWAFRHGEAAGLGTATLSARAWRYVPLQAPMRVRGVLALTLPDPGVLAVPEHARQLDTLARQIAIALERVHYVDIAQQAVVDMESERLRNTLLGALSHDIRTPLTVLRGLAEGLPGQPAERHAETARAIAQQTRALHALVTNLLDMARLDGGLPGGGPQLRRDWQSVEEVVGAAIRASEAALGAMPVHTHLPADLPLVEFDAVLVERVLVNLLENAAKYGAAPVEVRAWTDDSLLHLTIADHGPGLPASLRGPGHTPFDKFTRGHVESSIPGVGLGLAICKAIAQAHGGDITAETAAGGGAVFHLALPRREPPELTAD
ncbi:DUF4118 domain-containing protein [Acidovorax sp. Leaf160]|uniref:DUF4118 domain-containing protein n=1 Tax=Acidovorax sp. Leaf160 TaxID=1736280 RepID=UPI0006FA4A57|nr:DUF4118 domain-containing protein [Acidovorax sp. Leaf160]KQR55368.1 sensor protein KdpD [Acidovorax sp. Leaf160]